MFSQTIDDEVLTIKNDQEKLKQEIVEIKKDLKKVEEAIIKVKSENEYLKNALKVGKPIETLNYDKIDFAITAVEGNSTDQTVTIHLLLNNNGATRPLQFTGQHQLKDVEGNLYQKSTGSFVRESLITNTPLKFSVTFKEIMPDVKIIRSFLLSFYNNAAPGRDSSVEFRNLSIDWK